MNPVAKPPGKICLSTSKTFLLDFANRNAAVKPPFPAPITKASYRFSSMPISLQLNRLHFTNYIDEFHSKDNKTT